MALVVIYAFIPTLDNGFVAWDDDQNFLDNPHFRGLGAAQLKWACSTSWLGVYQPLAWLLFEAQYVLCRLDPRGYHLPACSSSCQRRGSLCLDGGLARPMPELIPASRARGRVR